MKNNKKLIIIIAIVTLSAISSAMFFAKPKKTIDNTANITIVYEYKDSSVPPKYHRSYVVTVNPEELHIVVDSYGDVLKDKTYPISNKEYMAVINAFNSARMKNKTVIGAPIGCTGGTSQRLSVREADEVIFEGYLSSCGGKEQGNMGGNIDSIVKEIMKLVPFTPELVKYNKS